MVLFQKAYYERICYRYQVVHILCYHSGRYLGQIMPYHQHEPRDHKYNCTRKKNSPNYQIVVDNLKKTEWQQSNFYRKLCCSNVWYDKHGCLSKKKRHSILVLELHATNWQQSKLYSTLWCLNIIIGLREYKHMVL